MWHGCMNFLENERLWLMWALFQVWRWLLLRSICNAINKFSSFLTKLTPTPLTLQPREKIVVVAGCFFMIGFELSCI